MIKALRSMISAVPVRAVLAAALLAFIAVSCGDDTPTTSTVSGVLKVRQVVSLPSTVTWRKVWGLDAGHVFVMGDGGHSYQGNGLTWTQLPSTKAPDRLLLGAWGDRADNVFFVGTILNNDTVTVTEIEDSDTTTTTTIYDVPWLSNFNGVAFENVLVDFEHGSLNDIWGSGPDNIYAVGDLGTIVHYDGTAWTTLFHGGTSPVEFMSVWGTGSDNVFVCGTSGTLMHFDGFNWRIMTTGTPATLWQAWGPRSDTVYIVGSGGVILYYNGLQLSKMTSPVTSSLYSVWGTASNDVYAAGYNGVLLHYDGASWTELDIQTVYSLLSVWGSGPDDFYVVGQTVLRGSGELAVDRVAGAQDINDIWISSTGEVSPLRVAVGDSGLTMTSGNGTSWTLVPSNTAAALNGTWGDPGSTLRFAVGDNGTILTFTAGDTEWEDISPAIAANLNAVSGLSDSTVWAVGDNGTLLQFNYGATSWVTIPTGITARLNDIWADVVGTDTLVFAVGDNGWTLVYSGSLWEASQAPSTENLLGVTGDGARSAYAVGDNGTLLKWQSGAWTEIGMGRTENFRAVWMVPGTPTVFVAGESGRFLSYNGSTWTEINGVTSVDLNGLFGYDSENINIVGDYEHLLLYSR